MDSSARPAAQGRHAFRGPDSDCDDRQSPTRDSLPADHADTGNSLATLFETAGELAERFALTSYSGAHRLADLRQRRLQRRFHLAVLGQFKRGKSTFLNALLGEDLLPSSVLPVTALPIFIEFAPTARLRVSYADRRPSDDFSRERGDDLKQQLFRVAAEVANPKNRLGVSRIDLFHPAPILGRGFTLIDTPGVGSTFRHNTEAALAFLAECDAALFITSMDPPLTEAESEFLIEVRRHVTRFVFILNKADNLTDDERTTGIDYLERVLASDARIRLAAPIFAVSSRQALQAKLAPDPALLGSSGLPAVERHLTDVLEHEKDDLLDTALAAKARDATDSILLQLDLQLRSLRMPIEDLERRLSAFDKAIVDIGRERRAATDSLFGDRSRTLAQLEEEAAALRQRGGELLGRKIREVFADASAADADSRARAAVAANIPPFFERERADFSQRWRELIAGIFASHRRRADRLIDSVRMTAAQLFDIPAPPVEETQGFESFRMPYWVTESTATSFVPTGEGIVDGLLPRSARRRRQMQRLVRDADALVLTNVENLRWSTRQNIEQVFRRFEADLDERLAQTIEATHGAIRSAYDRRRETSEQCSPDIERLESATKGFAGLRDGLARLAPSPAHASPSPQE